MGPVLPTGFWFSDSVPFFQVGSAFSKGFTFLCPGNVKAGPDLINWDSRYLKGGPSFIGFWFCGFWGPEPVLVIESADFFS